MKTGVIIGRFQVPYLHLGHIHLISTSLRENDVTVVFLGCQEIPDKRNMYNAEYRIEIIRKIFPHVSVHLLPDMEKDEDWSKQIDTLCESLLNPRLYHSRDSFRDHYTGKYSLREVDELPGYSGTELRKNTS